MANPMDYTSQGSTGSDTGLDTAARLGRSPVLHETAIRRYLDEDPLVPSPAKT